MGTLNELTVCNVFHKRRSPKHPLIPTWDIGLVLRALSLALFEPLEIATFEAITYKKIVLIALALGAHMAKLCALRHGQFIHPARQVFHFVIFRSVVYS